MKGYKVPSFGSWNFYEEKHVDGFVQAHFFVEDGEELFEMFRSYKHHQPQVRKLIDRSVSYSFTISLF